VGNALTECPAGGRADRQAAETARTSAPRTRSSSSRTAADDNKTNQDYAWFPRRRNVHCGESHEPAECDRGRDDYRLGFGTSGFYATTDNGTHWYDGIKPFRTTRPGPPITSTAVVIPSVVYDRGGTAYYNDLHFMRENDESGIFVARSRTGASRWSRPCVPAALRTPTHAAAATATCGGPVTVSSRTNATTTTR